ncbi:hypothetical protein Bcer98_4039 (plasmid) [Bacillus cytotoxicus NVH 391-98]|uniref:Uncharacterized protein n=1 Tax=Bacillus cytotoxicus (strain DSM 22905 / CIP 110041 / 391-98 / NVH 391-98) TaxID=315749 RepID=A7GVR2_BACCN|nr:hypothetical protein [Bacillus cytotoxicus]ABS24220.1 hypothetical protein Bcer98_4039 [Bacillus cytotoxicus NVH 391-98]QTR73047.1 hypothetical protein JC775_20370 [Bacillus cytotoxicus]HDR4573532.1 hypothetical protein [Bacillus cytotoxicus]HDR4589611.1 hypothetical protein [Bacillus cytotoxicus]
MSMKIIEIVNEINAGERVPVIAKRLGVSKDTLSRRLKSVGYKFDNSLKKYVYFGNNSEKNHIDNVLFSSLVMKRTEGSKNKFRNLEEKESVEVGISSEIFQNVNLFNFSNSEIKTLKEVIKVFQDEKSKLFLELVPLLDTGKVVKKTILVGDELYVKFEKFAERFTNKHISKHQLIELALYNFMKQYNVE